MFCSTRRRPHLEGCPQTDALPDDEEVVHLEGRVFRHSGDEEQGAQEVAMVHVGPHVHVVLLLVADWCNLVTLIHQRQSSINTTN